LPKKTQRGQRFLTADERGLTLMNCRRRSVLCRLLFKLELEFETEKHHCRLLRRKKLYSIGRSFCDGLLEIQVTYDMSLIELFHGATKKANGFPTAFVRSSKIGIRN
jgi:hypothetical protein